MQGEQPSQTTQSTETINDASGANNASNAGNANGANDAKAHKHKSIELRLPMPAITYRENRRGNQNAGEVRVHKHLRDRVRSEEKPTVTKV